MLDKINLQQLLRDRANREAIPQNAVVQPVKSGQGLEPAVASNKSARGEVTMDKFIEDIRNLFVEGGQLGMDVPVVVQNVVIVAQDFVKEQKAKFTGAAAVQTTASSATVTTQFDGINGLQQTQKSSDDIAPPAVPSGPSH